MDLQYNRLDKNKLEYDSLHRKEHFDRRSQGKDPCIYCEHNFCRGNIRR